MSHTLLVVTLIISEAVSALLESLTDTYYTSVTENTEDAVNKMEQAIQEAEYSRTELQQFKQKWKIITEFKVDGSQLKKDFVLVNNVALENSSSFGGLVSLSCNITYNGDTYYVLIDKSSMYTIVLKDGSVIEVPYYDSPYYNYSLGYSSNSLTLEIKDQEFVGFNAEDVDFIKLSNLQIKRIQFIYGEKPMLTDYEIVLYQAKQ